MLCKKLIVFIIFLVPVLVFSQETEQDSTSRMVRVVDSTQTTLDTIAPTPLSTILKETAPAQDRFEMTKSPSGAVWRSLVAPGWGQWYVGDKWKTPVFAAAYGTVAFLIVRNQINYNDKDDEYQAALTQNPASADLLKRQREVYRDNRDQAAFALVGVYIISMVDAYVGAHLYDFSVDDDISFGFKNTADGAAMLHCSIRF
ncbi:MAG: DUF5683 domain-containing protein [Bacteroidota bacterium]